jgi:hypothetical protein
MLSIRDLVFNADLFGFRVINGLNQGSQMAFQTWGKL